MQTRKRKPSTHTLPVTDTKELKAKFSMAHGKHVCVCKQGTSQRKIIQVGLSQMSLRICDSCGGTVNRD